MAAVITASNLYKTFGVRIEPHAVNDYFNNIPLDWAIAMKAFMQDLPKRTRDNNG
jgi:hypothetical protein